MKANQEWVYGLHSLESILTVDPSRILHLYVQETRRDDKTQRLAQLSQKQGIAISYVSRDVLDSMTKDGNHQGIAALCKPMRMLNENNIEEILQAAPQPALILVLDGVQDPHNLGAIFRTADATGVAAIIAPKDNAVSITPTVTKVASGAVASVPFIQVTNLVRTLEILKTAGFWIYGTDDAVKETLYDLKLQGSIALVLGAEGKGLRRLTREHCDVLVNIPMLGRISSLNVSVAAGVCLYEIVRQRR
ncbi:MAG: 23S rRNA (guanosine(2251)-2'-O)-methyltransferase RlmB [Gammaproteobacteria bacterium]|nr:23S rRNA (guanosine(2251)-2'-O)-methyltransferase RlmB [Gammaproteobacteria bacterium]